MTDRIPHDTAGWVAVRDGDISAVFDLRPGSTDATVVDEVWCERVYPVTADDVAGKTVVDLGANIGAFTLWAALHGAATVVAVEPVDANLVRLGRHLRINLEARPADIDVQFLFGAVVGASHLDRHYSMRGAPDLDGNAQLSPDPEGTVPLFTLDDIVTRAGGRVDVAKIDVEGAEYQILGDTAVLNRIDRIVGEWHWPPILRDPAVDTAEHWLGEMMANLCEHGDLHIFGRPSTAGGQFEWARYR